MKILSIETSCDETGISLLQGNPNEPFDIKILGNALASQIDLHARYGGVFPAMAKRAHVEKFIPLLKECLLGSGFLKEKKEDILGEEIEVINALTIKETGLKGDFIKFFSSYEKPEIDYIAVTTGPGLEPALWVGVNAAKVISAIWNIPIIPINHMEGHVLVTMLQNTQTDSEKDFVLGKINFPALALLVSGGHTELVLIKDYANFEKIGETRDDAVGEAFDKVARMIDLSYPGGPAVSKLASQCRNNLVVGLPSNGVKLPRPMLHTKDYDFSFSGIKTAVLYHIRDLMGQKEKEGLEPELSNEEKESIAHEFENAVVEVLVKKTTSAVLEHHISTLIVGGGVAGNTYLKNELTKSINSKSPQTSIFFPKNWLATDNSVMIGVAAFARLVQNNYESPETKDIVAYGNLSITDGGFRK